MPQSLANLPELQTGKVLPNKALEFEFGATDAQSNSTGPALGKT
jgi:hypothetical protein